MIRLRIDTLVQDLRYALRRSAQRGSPPPHRSSRSAWRLPACSDRPGWFARRSRSTSPPPGNGVDVDTPPGCWLATTTPVAICSCVHRAGPALWAPSTVGHLRLPGSSGCVGEQGCCPARSSTCSAPPAPRRTFNAEETIRRPPGDCFEPSAGRSTSARSRRGRTRCRWLSLNRRVFESSG